MNKICPKCQTENLDISKFCKKCGSPLSEAHSSNPTPAQALSDIEKRATEEKLYEQVSMELKNGIRKEGLYTKAFADANGSVELANAFYIKYAVQSLRDELMLEAQLERALFEQQLMEEKNREKIRQEEQLRQEEQPLGKERELELKIIVMVIVVFFIVVIANNL